MMTLSVLNFRFKISCCKHLSKWTNGNPNVKNLEYSLSFLVCGALMFGSLLFVFACSNRRWSIEEQWVFCKVSSWILLPISEFHDCPCVQHLNSCSLAHGGFFCWFTFPLTLRFHNEREKHPRIHPYKFFTSEPRQKMGNSDKVTHRSLLVFGILCWQMRAAWLRRSH